jgi:hypothetical protein
MSKLNSFTLRIKDPQIARLYSESNNQRILYTGVVLMIIRIGLVVATISLGAKTVREYNHLALL